MIFTFFKDVTPYISSKSVKNTSLSFKLVTYYTLMVYFGIFFLIFAKNLFGEDTIRCYSSDEKSPFKKAMELKCWLDGVYLDKELMASQIGKETIRYGVGAQQKGEEIKEIRFKFYQWIVPMLLFQAFCLFVPRLFWLVLEGGKMDKLFEKLDSPVFTDEWEKQRKQLVAYVKQVNTKYHTKSAIQYLFCEILTIFVIVINMLVMKLVITDFWNVYQGAVTAFFQLDFSRFGKEAAHLFPIMAKCDFQAFGPGGSIQRLDSLCILPQNVVNDKVFAILYVWYIGLLIIATLNLMCLFVMYAFKKLRIFNVGVMLDRNFFYRDCKKISGDGNLGLWFTLNIYQLNMAPTLFQDVCGQLIEKKGMYSREGEKLDIKPDLIDQCSQMETTKETQSESGSDEEVEQEETNAADLDEIKVVPKDKAKKVSEKFVVEEI